MNIINLKIKDLKPYEKNAKKHDKTQIDNVAESIKQFGMVQPIVVDKDNIVIIGHCRLEACKKLKYKEVPCVKAEDLDEEQVAKLRLLDNKLNESEWDFNLLGEELFDLDLSDFELDWGLPELVEEEKEVEEDDFDCTPPEQPNAKLGDIYKLGKHRLMCGDSTKEEDVAKLMDGKLADLVLTDPPYNVDVSNSKGLKIQNDNMQDNDFFCFLYNSFANLEKSMKKDGVFYIWGIDHKIDIFIKAIKDNRLNHYQTIIWNKNTFVLGHLDYHKKHEPCIYGWRNGDNHYFTDNRTQNTVIEDRGIDLKKLKKEEMLKILQDIFSDKFSTTIINEQKPMINDLHPTMKPIKLLARLIKNSSRTNETVLDLFGGSGSTLIACEQLNRNCYMMELDPKYVDVIIARWEQFTGKKAEKLN